MGVMGKKFNARQKMAGVNGKKSKKKKIIILAGILVLVGAGAGTAVVLAKKNTDSQLRPDGTAMEATASRGDISNTVVGTGNLEADTATAVTIPSGLVMDEVRVESGDHVEKGDVLAVVNEASVLSAMENAQAFLDALDGELGELGREDEEEITSKVSGRVKKIYVNAGEDAGDAMIEHGAVMLLSADGKLAVSIEAEATIVKGNTVTVSREDGSSKTGTVESVDGTTCVVVFSDYGIGMGETVTVTDAGGTALGKGITYIHQEIQVTVTGGTVSRVCVSEDEAVDSGEALLILNSDSQSVKEKELIATREAMAATLQKLITVAKAGTITADMNGTVADVNISAGSSTTGTTAGSTSTGSTTAGKTGTSSVGSTVQGMSTGASSMVWTMSTPVSSSAQTMSTETVIFSPEETVYMAEEETDGFDGAGDANDPEDRIQLYFAVKGSGASTRDTLAVELPEANAVPQAVIRPADGSYSGTIAWNPSGSTFAGETSYQAEISLYAAEGYCFGADSVLSVETGVISGIAAAQDGSSLSFRITFPQTEKQSADNDGEDAKTGNNSSKDGFEGLNADGGGQDPSGTGDTGAGDTGTSDAGNINTGNAGTGNTNTGDVNSSGNTDNTGNNGTGSSAGTTTGTAAGSSAQDSGTDTTSSAAADGDTSDSSEYSTDITAFTISSDDAMILSVSVDELDINSISPDQEAEVSLDAIEDQTFAGTVTEVGNTASASGGVAKYTVKIQIPKDAQMKTGMNASATIVIEKKENVVTIPVNALQERKEETFVYTEKDEDGNLGGEIKVTTGLSDGDTVEITEGLSDGDTVYYQKTGNVNSSSGGMFEGGFGSEERGDRQNQGEMPGGGGMPSGSGMQNGGGMPSAGGGMQ